MSNLVDKIKEMFSVGDIPNYYWKTLDIKHDLDKEINNKKEKFFNLKKKDNFLDLLVDLVFLESASFTILNADNKSKNRQDRDNNLNIQQYLDYNMVIEKAYKIINLKNKKKKNKIYEELKFYISNSKFLYKDKSEIIQAFDYYFNEINEKKIKNNEHTRIIILFSIILIVIPSLLYFIEYPILTGKDGPWAFEVTVEVPAVTEIVYVYTPTVDPTIAAMPTPVPTSQFLEMKYELADIYPTVPEDVTEMYLLDDKDAFLIGNWVDAFGSGIGSKHRMINLSSVTEELPTSVTWMMDTPIIESGLFEIFVLDPLSEGGFLSNESLVYQVSDQNGLISPISGSNEITQLSSRVQEEDLWRSIGIYTLDIGSVVSVRVDIPVGNYHAYSIFGADAVLISKMEDPQLNQVALSMPGFISEEKNVLFVLDDEAMIKMPEEGWLNYPVNENRWGNASGYLLNDVNSPLPSINYELSHALLEGKYELWAWVDAELSVPIQYSVDLKKVSNNLAFYGFTEYLSEDGGAGGLNIDPATGNVLGRAVLLGTLSITEPVILNVDVAAKNYVDNGLFISDAIIILQIPDEIVE